MARTAELEKEQRDADLLLLVLHTLYLMVRGNPHTLRRLARCDNWVPLGAEKSPLKGVAPRRSVATQDGEKKSSGAGGSKRGSVASGDAGGGNKKKRDSLNSKASGDGGGGTAKEKRGSIGSKASG